AMGSALFDGRLARVGAGPQGVGDSVRFEVPAGRVEVDLTILDAGGKVLDSDVRDIDVPNLASSEKAGPVFVSPEIVRTRTLRDFEMASADPDAAPSPLRTFDRGDRVLIRAYAFDPGGTPVQVT